MKTTKEDHERLETASRMFGWTMEGVRTVDTCDMLRRILSDLSRLAAIEEARAKGGLTSGERAIVPETQGIIIRLDDALRAANEELERVNSRALAAEGRLRTLERMLLQADDIEIEWDAPNDRWQFAAETGRAFPTIEGCLDAWAAAHKEEA